MCALSSVTSLHAINSYDEYGIPGSSNQGRFQYTGQLYLPEIGMYYYKARMYSPTLGRFMQTDPIGYGDGMNWYAYTGNDPVNATDPDGLDHCSDLGLTTIQNGHGVPMPMGEQSIPVTWVQPRCGGSISDYYYNQPQPPQNPGQNGSSNSGTATVSPISGHHYKTDDKVCSRVLLPAEMADLLSRFARTRLAGEQMSTGWHVAWGHGFPGLVRTDFLRGGLTVVNTTAPLHAFVGSIRRDIVARGGATYVLTEGSGNAQAFPFDPVGMLRDTINAATGPGIFHQLDNAASRYATAHFKGC